VRGVRLMDAEIALLAAACIAVLGLQAWVVLSWWREQRAERRGRRAAPHTSRTSLISDRKPGGPPGGPDWPLPPGF
jgi:uncharacterized iron-regulated membrane protein